MAKTLRQRQNNAPLIYSYHSPAKTTKIQPLKLPEGGVFEKEAQEYDKQILLSVLEQQLEPEVTNYISITGVSPVFAHHFGFHATPVNYFNATPPEEATTWDDDENPSS